MTSRGDDGRPAGFARLLARLASTLGLRPEPGGFVLQTPRAVRPGGGLEGLVREATQERQRRLLAESLALLDEADRRVITLRLDGSPYEAVADRLRLSPDAAMARYALAISRLAERLSWVADLQGRGVSPPERAVLGQVRFTGRRAQEIALRLRLPEEVVEHWIRLSDQERGLGPGATR